MLAPLLISFSRYINFLDKPSERKTHKIPIPLSGGLTIFMVTFAFSKVLLKDPFIDTIIVYGVFFFILGIIDDLFNLNPFVKLLIQILLVFLFLKHINPIYFVNFFYNNNLNFLLTLFWFLFVINAINLIDGIDGLAAGLSFLLFTSVSSIAIQNNYANLLTFALIFASSLIIFLRFNIPPAKVFLGDSGSLYLGFVISAVSLSVYSKSVVSYSFFIPIMFLLIPLLDVVRVAFKRFKKGTNIFKADKEHIHYKLLDYGFSDRQVLLILYSITCLISILTLKNYSQNVKIIGLITVFTIFLSFIIYSLFDCLLDLV